MADPASITFVFDGSDCEFGRLYEIISSVGLDVGGFSKGSTGVIEFIVDDFDEFKEEVARKSEQLNMDLVALDYFLSEDRYHL
ncbi:MAG: hypothetical protein EOP88_25245 [Verrucomicrobiaceae bacterium]|nr:MAG: hypothetical protein EOP88_25245 [Verrucomicrobiaceae bacterium]